MLSRRSWVDPRRFASRSGNSTVVEPQQTDPFRPCPQFWLSRDTWLPASQIPTHRRHVLHQGHPTQDPRSQRLDRHGWYGCRPEWKPSSLVLIPLCRTRVRARVPQLETDWRGDASRSWRVRRRIKARCLNPGCCSSQTVVAPSSMLSHPLLCCRTLFYEDARARAITTIGPRSASWR